MTRDPLGRPPAVLLLPAALGALALTVPLVTLVAGTPWRDLGTQLASEPVRQALWLSLLVATVSMAVCLIVGLPLAWLLARVAFRGRRVLRVLVTIPLVLPPVVAGVALMTAFGRTGVLGEPLRAFGLQLPFTTAGVVAAHVFVCLPFVVLSIEGALHSTRAEYDAAAATLGATRWTIFHRVTVPLALPGIAAGLVLGWARSIGEFGATITFAGNYPGTTQTMPTLVYQRLQSEPEAAHTLSLVMLLVSVGVLLLLRDRWVARP